MHTTPEPNPPPPAVSVKVKKAMLDTMAMAKRLGAGAAALVGRLKKDRSPQAMIATMDESMAANRTRRVEVSAKADQLFQEISEKKKAFASAPPARQRLLEAELRSRLSEYQAVEKELTVLLENERVLSTVKGRLSEVLAYDLRGVTELQIDDVIDDIDDRAEDAEAVSDAAGDLEKAGRRREREEERVALWDALDGFDTAAEAAPDDEPMAPDREKARSPAPAAGARAKKIEDTEL